MVKQVELALAVDSVWLDLLQGHTQPCPSQKERKSSRVLYVAKPPQCFGTDRIQATRLFSAMLEDLVMDAALQGHHETARGRVPCQICRTR